VLFGEVRDELLLLVGDLFPLGWAHHTHARGVSRQVGIVQSPLGLVEDMRQRPVHRRGGQSGRADQVVGILARATRKELALYACDGSAVGD